MPGERSREPLQVWHPRAGFCCPLLPRRCSSRSGAGSRATEVHRQEGSGKDGFVWIHGIAIWKTRTVLLFPKASLMSLHFCMSQLCNLKKISSFSPSHSKISSLWQHQEGGHPSSYPLPGCAGWFYLHVHLQEDRRTERGWGQLKGTDQGGQGSRQPGATELPWCQNTPYSSTVGPADERCCRNRNYCHRNFSLHQKAKTTISYSHPPYDFIHYDHVLWHRCVLLLEETEHCSQQSTRICTDSEILNAFTGPAVLQDGVRGVSGWKRPMEMRTKHALWHNSDTFVTEMSLVPVWATAC